MPINNKIVMISIEALNNRNKNMSKEHAEYLSSVFWAVPIAEEPPSQPTSFGKKL